MTHIEFNLHCARVACANYVGYVDHIETALVALSLVGVTGPRALSLAVRGLLPRTERQLSAMRANLNYADTTMRREIENVEHFGQRRPQSQSARRRAQPAARTDLVRAGWRDRWHAGRGMSAHLEIARERYLDLIAEAIRCRCRRACCNRMRRRFRGRIQQARSMGDAQHRMQSVLRQRRQAQTRHAKVCGGTERWRNERRPKPAQWARWRVCVVLMKPQPRLRWDSPLWKHRYRHSIAIHELRIATGYVDDFVEQDAADVTRRDGGPLMDFLTSTHEGWLVLIVAAFFAVMAWIETTENRRDRHHSRTGRPCRDPRRAA